MKRWMSLGMVAVLAGVLAGTLMAADEAAAKVYAAKCKSCHGADGKGNPAMAKAFKIDPALLSLVGPEVQKHTDEELIKITTDGENKMPAYKGKLTEAEIKAQVAHIRSLAPKP
jgi:cytochrome c6